MDAYIASNHNDLTKLDRLRMVKDVSAGLCYLHSVHVVHGDMTGVSLVEASITTNFELTGN